MSTFTLPALPVEKKDSLQKLRERHRRIVQLHTMGLKNVHIAAQLNITTQAVGYCLNSDVGMIKTEELVSSADDQAKDVSSIIREALPNAIGTLEKILNGEVDASISLQAKVAMDVLDRGGHGKITNIQGDFRHGYFGPVGVEGIEAINKRAKELGVTATVSKVVEGEIVEE